MQNFNTVYIERYEPQTRVQKNLIAPLFLFWGAAAPCAPLNRRLCIAVILSVVLILSRLKFIFIVGTTT